MGVSSISSLLAERNFKNLWLGQLVSQLGDGVTSLTLLIVINKLTGSTVALATMAIAIALPQLVFGLISGVYVDRWDRQRIMILSDVVRGLAVLGFITVRTADDVWICYVVGFFQAAVGTLFGPAKSALLPALVKSEHLMVANGLSAMTQDVTMVVGASVAGVMIGMFDSPVPAFCFDAATFFTSAAFVTRIATTKIALPAAQRSASDVLRELSDGLRSLFSDRQLSAALVTYAATMLGTGAVNVLFVPYLMNVLHVRVQTLGAVSAVQVVGMLLGSGLVAVATRLKPNDTLNVGVMVGGVLIAGLGAAPTLWWVLLILFALCVCSTPLQAALDTLLQTRVSNDKRGRAASVMNTAATTTAVLSMAFAGVLGDAIGVRQVFFLAGAIIFTAGLLSKLTLKGA